MTQGVGASPLRVREDGCGTELFGAYHPQKEMIRIWIRTAVQKWVTWYYTFFSTLCHEWHDGMPGQQSRLKEKQLTLSLSGEKGGAKRRVRGGTFVTLLGNAR